MRTLLWLGAGTSLVRLNNQGVSGLLDLFSLRMLPTWVLPDIWLIFGKVDHRPIGLGNNSKVKKKRVTISLSLNYFLLIVACVKGRGLVPRRVHIEH